MNDEAPDQASERYDSAEQTYMSALASGADDATLRTMARQVAEAARAWERADASAVPPADVTRYYDVPEVVSSLWRDLADAYDRRAP
ncbi:hypothetical protein [Aquipuribacter sp. MA13-6]|uniref:hypothetical protein n=1 Tax=unclassified Aquipuribacter TaxID=2635084 RepID=UPI003EEEF009